MAVPKRKTSKMKKRSRKASKRFSEIQVNFDSKTGIARMPHRICTETGIYKDKEFIKKTSEN